MLLWTRQFGTARDDNIAGIAADGLGNVYATGFSAEHDAWFPSPDTFLNKYDATGELQWQIDDCGPIYCYTQSSGVSADPLGNVFITGVSLDEGHHGSPVVHSTFLRTYDAAGNLQWTRSGWPTPSDVNSGVSADGLGNVYISGITFGSLGGPHLGNGDAFISKYDAAGNVEWTRQLGTAEGEESYGVSADGLGNVYISGLTTGSLGGPFRGLSDAFVSNYDASGNLQWTRQFGTNSFDISYGVSADRLGNVYISGKTGGNLGGPNAGQDDPFIAKYCVGCEPEPPEPVAPFVVDVQLPGEIFPGSLVTHQLTALLGDPPITWATSCRVDRLRMHRRCRRRVCSAGKQPGSMAAASTISMSRPPTPAAATWDG